MKDSPTRGFRFSISTLFLGSSVLAVAGVRAFQILEDVIPGGTAQSLDSLFLFRLILFDWVPIGFVLGTVSSVVYFLRYRSIQYVLEFAAGSLGMLTLDLLRDWI